MPASRTLAILCSFLLIAPVPNMFAWEPRHFDQQANQASPTQPLSADQLDSLVAPLALYPDPILSQVLVASTYPLEIVEAQRWLDAHASLSGKALADAAAKESWDASVQALVMMPDLLRRLAKDIQWTSDLGNVFLAQESDVMTAIQRMRQKAQARGALQSNAQQTVGTTADNGQNYITIEPAQPEVVYVPQYDPVAVWGAPAYYPYPPIWYPPAFSFGAGFFLGAIWGGGGWGGWGWGPSWGHNNIVVNNNFINRNNFNRANVGNGNRWVHNPNRPGNPNRGGANRLPGGNRPTTRPTVGDTQRRLGETGRGGGAGTGGANRLGPGNPGRGQGAGQGAGRGGANRPNPGGAGGGINRPANPGMNRPSQGMPSRGGANRMAPPSGGFNRGGGGGFHGGGFNRGGGGFHGGGGGFRGGGGHRGGGGRRR